MIRPKNPPLQHATSWRTYLLIVAIVLLTTAIGFPLRSLIDPTNIVMLYLVVTVFAAVWLERRPAIVTAVLSVIAFDFIFVPTYYTFHVTDAEYLLTFIGLLAVGIVISTLSASTREQARAISRREAQTEALFALSQKLALVSDRATIAQTTVTHFQETLSSPTALYLPVEEGGQVQIEAQTSGFMAADADDETSADQVFQTGQPTERYTDSQSDARQYYLPLRTSGQTVGVLAIDFSSADYSTLSPEQRRFLTTLASQVALTLEKARLAEKARQAHLLEETEKLQTTLLNAISHDLRTPLAVITGALSSLLHDADLLSAAAQHDLTQNAWEEALRLNRLVGNLLDMTRLESGVMKVLCQPHDVRDFVGTTLAQIPNQLQGREVKLTIPASLPPISIDFSLLGQTLINLVGNAVKYSPDSEPIEIEACQDGETVVIAVKDRGQGMPDAELDHIFTKFFRLNAKGVAGSGLGLSIAKGIVEAHGGRIWAENRPNGGAIFSIALPIAQLETV